MQYLVLVIEFRFEYQGMCICYSFFLATLEFVDHSLLLIRGEPERAPNTRETGSGVYIYIYLFVRDLAWQRPNAHAQSPRVRT